MKSFKYGLLYVVKNALLFELFTGNCFFAKQIAKSIVKSIKNNKNTAPRHTRLDVFNVYRIFVLGKLIKVALRVIFAI